MRSTLSLGLLCGALLGCEATDASLGLNGPEADEIATDVQSALEAFPRAQVTAMGPRGVPRHVKGELGKLSPSKIDDVELGRVMKPLAKVFRLNASELEVQNLKVDALETTHVRLAQRRNGLEVVGGELVLHVDKAGEVFAVSGTAEGGDAVSATPTVGAEAAVAAAKALMVSESVTLESTEAPTLLYVQPTKGGLNLAWNVTVAGVAQDGTPVREAVYVDAQTGAIAERHGLLHFALNRRIYTGGNTTRLPGTQLRAEGGAAVSDAVANRNYDLLGQTYECYRQLFGRDSVNGNGLTLHSTVHHDVRLDNAYWNGQQMVYGDGSGLFGNFATSFDVTVHELTHGVTQYESNLVYQSEPGALDESIADIFAAVCQVWSAGNVVSQSTWQLAEDIYTPTRSGDAMRYMDNPTLDRQSRDYYPERYTGTQDNGGVHLNSGIPNLAFKLMVTGGTHPRGRTNVQVPALGIDKASKIFYRANNNYLTRNSSFQAARAATAQAATDLYGADAANAVHLAWNAVGVPGAPATTTPPPTTPPPATGNVLKSGVPVNGLSAATGQELRFTIQVPAGNTSFLLKMSGGTGDADLYIRRGTPPTTTEFDARPFLTGNEESVSGTNVPADTYHVMIRAYEGFSGVSLLATF